MRDENGEGVYNIECRLFKGEELIAMAATNADGEAELRFTAVNNTDTLDLYITGMNGWPQHLEIGFDNDNCAHVLFDNYSLNDPDGQMDFNESLILNVGFRNVGNLAASNVSAVLTCEQTDYITVTQGQTIVGDIDTHETKTIDEAFAITISDDVPDQTVVTFTLTCTDGTNTWVSQFDVTVNAPDFGPIVTVLEEVTGNGNGHADSGETITLHFTGQNTGHSLSPDTYFSAYCYASEITYNENVFSVGDIAPGDTFTVDLNINIADNRAAAAYEFFLATYSGNYLVPDIYYVNVDSDIEDFETGHFDKFDWQFDGNGEWEVKRFGAYEGSYSAHTRPMDHNSHADMFLDYDFVCDNEISFYVKTSTETGYDFLNFYIDDNRMGRWSGETDWTLVTYMIPQGSHRLTWSYVKDGGAVGGQDCVWVDYIVLPPTVIVDNVDEVSDSESTLYPNPTHGDFTLALRRTSQVSVFNLMGQNVLNLNNANGLQHLHLDAAGVYFVRISNDNGIEVKKVVVK